MNIFATITNRTMKQNKARTIVTIIGVILATAMISAVITLGISLQRYMYDYAVETDGNWHVVAKGLSEEQVKEFQENEEVKDSSVISEIGYAKIGENDEDLFGQYLYLQSIDEKAAEMLSVKLTQGRLPENENEIIIQGGLQQNDNEIRIGDTISFPVGDRKDAEGNSLPFNAYIQVDEEGNPMETFQEREQRQFEVVGFLEHWGDTQVAGAGLDAFTGKGEESQSVNQIYMELKNPSDAFAFMEKYEDEFSMQGNTSVLRWMGVSGNASFEGMLNGMLTILIVIIGVGAVSLIYNAFSISLRERTTQFGLLSSIGATKRQLRRSMWQEALVVGAIGIPIGILCGIGGIGVTLYFIGDSMAQFIHGTQSGKMTLQTSPGAILLSALIAFLIICISVWIPAARIKKITPLEAIRANKDVRIRAKEVKSPKIIQKLFGLEGMLADKNYKRDRKKYRATVFSLTISIVLFTSATLFSNYMDMTGSFMLEAPEYELQFVLVDSEEDDIEGKDNEREDLLQMFEQGEDVDEVELHGEMSMPAGIAKEDLADEATNHIWGYGLQEFYTITEEAASPFNEKDYYEYFEVIGLSDEAFEEYASSQGVNPAPYMQKGNREVLFYDNYQFYNGDSGRYENVRTIGQEGINIQILPENPSYDEEYQDPNTIMNGAESLVLGQRVDQMPEGIENSNSICTIVIPESRGEELIGTNSYNRSGFIWCYQIQSSNYQNSYEDLTQKMEERGIDKDSLRNIAQQYEQDRGIQIAIRILSFGFITLISLIAAVNVFNTISTNIMLRKREFAMLKSMGMNMKSMKKMMNYECLIYGFRSIFYGVILSLLISFAMFMVLSQGAAVDFRQPWEGILISVIWVFAVVFITMLYSMSKIKKQNIIDELKKDS
ncbi:FtsX-like permease family protein [Drancourtella massiliensis]|uniref:FtsX-like permease family protein n=1 Tax=Drancourtella massiliensis TaxID=1632013 RepID=A0ABS2EJP9_9FIRM|nr:ABC transporter permease [Drancourtella massiliensis]MBM6745073.1 FtsX-like permease family protein [Drancourtella massiliensis]